MDALRPFALGQSTPPVGPFNTVAQVFFSPDERHLLVPVKGDPPRPNGTSPGFLAVFPVVEPPAPGTGSRSGGASLAADGTRSSPAGTAVLFGSFAVPPAARGGGRRRG